VVSEETNVTRKPPTKPAKPTAYVLGALFLHAIAPSARASGVVEMPPITVNFPSHTLCRAQLNQSFQQQRQEASAKTTLPDGRTREVGFESRTHGVARISRTKSIYEGRVWYAYGQNRPEMGVVEVSHSWQEIRQHCTGRQLKTFRSSGFTLSSFEPMATKDTSN
jgi:hypothetical protein